MLPTSGDALYDAQLEPLAKYFRRPGLSEIVINEPCTIGLLLRRDGKNGPSEEWKYEAAPALTLDYFNDLCHALANKKGQAFDIYRQPRVSTDLPGGHRFEAMMGKVVASGLSCTIRVKRRAAVSLEDFGLVGEGRRQVEEAIKAGANLIVSGGTATGKTTLLNLLLELIPADKRLFIMEDTLELEVPHKNVTRRVLSRNETGVVIGYPEVFDHALRSRPDQILLGELATTNTYAALNLLNTGHRGFAATLHADSPQLALGEKFYQYLAFGGSPNLDPNYVERYLHKVVDVVVQVHRTRTAARQVTEIMFPAEGRTLDLMEERAAA